MNVDIQPITFTNERGKKLFGILHTPEEITREQAIIIISSGIKSRVAPHRLYVKMARRFTDLGFQVFRVDPEALGDSEGEIEEKWTADVYCSIEVGLLIDDTIAAMDWLAANPGPNRFVLTGLCGGAITALLTGVRDERVDGVLSLGMTSVLASSNLDPSKYITTGQLQSMRDKYVKKILDPASWKRFLSFKTDYRLMAKSFIKPALQKLSGTKKPAAQKNTKPQEINLPEDTNLNPHFPQAFLNFTSTRKILLIFSEADRLFWEFEEKFMRYYGSLVEQNSHNFEIFIVKDANHIFSFSEWQLEMLDKSCEWLQQLPASSTSSSQ